MRRELETGLAHHREHRLGEAETIYRTVLSKAPRNADALNLLGVIAQDCGRAAEAVALIARAVRIRRNFPEAWTNLARAQRAAGDAEGAIHSAREALALEPELAEAHAQLGRALLDLEDNEAAAAACRRAVELAPNALDAQVNLGAALSRLKDFHGAAQAYQAAHALMPLRAETLTDFGMALVEIDRCDDALRCHERAVALAPNDARTHAAHAAALRKAQEPVAALAACRRALALAPDRIDMWMLLGGGLAALGQFDEAIAIYRHILELDPACTEARRSIVAAGEHMIDAGELARMAAVADDPAADVEQRLSAGYALGALLDKAGDYDAAFARIAAASRLAREQQAAEGKGFDRAAFRVMLQRLMGYYSAPRLAAPPDFGIAAELPVFIVGMPRSGTTLVEQIIASHPIAFGAGERRDIGRLAKTLELAAGSPDPFVWPAEKVRQEAAAYLERLRAMAGEARRVTDKMPDNVLWLGLIAMLYPRARIVCCRRDLRDVCLSCYFQTFTDGLAWSNDLQDCAFRALGVEWLMEHWRKALPVPMLEVSYEALVADPETESRRLIEFVGLPWDPACLTFHTTERPILTASVWQVRQPLYASSVGRWRHYEPHLAPLIAALDAHGAEVGMTRHDEHGGEIGAAKGSVAA
ncbi:MAG TPA: sulfotransferase [Acetobacteraceae bacterium]|nr:sulfotransferase [Acetobacteraceae bacterium]